MSCVTVFSLNGQCILERNFKEDACIQDVKACVKIKHGHPVAAQVLTLLQEVPKEAPEDTKKLLDLAQRIELQLVLNHENCSIPDQVLSSFRIFAADPCKLPLEAIRNLFRVAARYGKTKEACGWRDGLEPRNTPLLVAVQAKDAATRCALVDVLWEGTAWRRERVATDEWLEQTRDWLEQTQDWLEQTRDWLEQTRDLRDAVLTDSNDSGWTALHFAAEAGDCRLIRKLLQKGKECGTRASELLNAETDSEPAQTPRQLALARGHLHAAALLYVWADAKDRMPTEECETRASELLSSETESQRTQTPLQLALPRGHLHAAAKLYAWADAEDRMPIEDIQGLLEAVERGSQDVVNA